LYDGAILSKYVDYLLGGLMNSEIQIEELLQQIQSQVERRRAEGLYPPGLEEQLEREFTEIMASTSRRYFAARELRGQLERLEAGMAGLSGNTAVTSKFLGGALIHRIVRKLVGRQILGLTAQMQVVNSLVLDTLKMVGEFAESQENADKRVVQELSQHVLDRIAVVDHLAILTIELEERILKLELSSDRYS
jgi:aconitase B